MRRSVLALTIAVAASAPACGGTSQTVTAPATVKCAVTATAEPLTFGPSGGNGTLAISTNRECQWSASVTGEWLQLGAEARGQGDAKIAFSVAANPEPAARHASIAVSDQQVAITQQAAPCTFRVSPSGDSAPPLGARRTITVSASSALCTWTARSDVDWLAIVEGAQGMGNGTVVYEVRPTEGPERTGTLVVAGHTIRVTQGVGCTFNLSDAEAALPAGAGSGSVQVLTAAGCPWTATSNAAWLTVTSGASATGPGDVRFNVAANTAVERKGTLAIAGRTFTVTQASGCTFTVSPGSASFGAAAESGSLQVATPSGCTWTATSSAAWLTVTRGAGSGPGEVRFNVAANAGPRRSATLTIGRATFTVTQASGCTYSISPTSHAVAVGGETRAVQVTTGAGCPWIAAASVDWIHFLTASGEGSGTAQFAVNPNPGPARSGTLTVAGSTVTVSQPDGCTIILSAQSASIGAAGGTGSVRVLTSSMACRWTARSEANWIVITAGSPGWGYGEVQFTVQPNTGPERTGTLNIGGPLFRVTQGGGG